jgi:hypothetical protein
VKGRVHLALALTALLWLAACASKPLVPFSTDTPPLILSPIALAGSDDKRARFREIYCAVLERDANQFPDYRPCDDALTRVGTEPAETGRAVSLEPSKRHFIAAVVPGIGYECIAPWLAPAGTVSEHLRKHGYELTSIKVDALSSSARNASQIRDAIMRLPAEGSGPRLVLIGYSKGLPDILQALVSYPEIIDRIVAVVSAAGAVGGSALANEAEQYQANLFRNFPGATCDAGDGGGVADLRTGVRKAWLAQNRLPAGPAYYSLVTFPQPKRISSILRGSYDKLSRIDARNDGQVIFYDQIIPGSALMGYVNADHWALVVPIARTHSIIGSLLATQNDYPREALAEAILRFVEEDLAGSAN